jgi:hypothetical protein
MFLIGQETDWVIHIVLRYHRKLHRITRMLRDDSAQADESEKTMLGSLISGYRQIYAIVCFRLCCLAALAILLWILFPLFLPVQNVDAVVVDKSARTRSSYQSAYTVVLRWNQNSVPTQVLSDTYDQLKVNQRVKISYVQPNLLDFAVVQSINGIWVSNNEDSILGNLVDGLLIPAIVVLFLLLVLYLLQPNEKTVLVEGSRRQGIAWKILDYAYRVVAGIFGWLFKFFVPSSTIGVQSLGSIQRNRERNDRIAWSRQDERDAKQTSQTPAALTMRARMEQELEAERERRTKIKAENDE